MPRDLAVSAPVGGPVAGAERVAGIDIGTNSIHLVVAERGAGGGVTVVDRWRHTARLGAGSHAAGTLADDAIDRALATLTEMRRRCEALGVTTVLAVATSAARDATNAAAFVERAHREAGIDVTVIDGATEARLIHLGVLAALGTDLDLDHRQHLVVDVGGGSTEVVVAVGTRRELAVSLQVGAIRLTDAAAPGGIVTGDTEAIVRASVRAELDRLGGIDQQVREQAPEVVIASSGSASTVVSMCRALDGDPRVRPSGELNGATVTRSEFASVVRRLLAAPDPALRRELPGLAPERVDIAPAGAVVLDEVLRRCSPAEPVASDVAFVFSAGALRDGLVAELLGPRDAPP